MLFVKSFGPTCVQGRDPRKKQGVQADQTFSKILGIYLILNQAGIAGATVVQLLDNCDLQVQALVFGQLLSGKDTPSKRTALQDSNSGV